MMLLLLFVVDDVVVSVVVVSVVVVCVVIVCVVIVCVVCVVVIPLMLPQTNCVASLASLVSGPVC